MNKDMHPADQAKGGASKLHIDGAEEFTIRPPKLVSITYTAVYDDGSFTTGVATHDGSERPFEVEFRNAKGRSTPLS